VAILFFSLVAASGQAAETETTGREEAASVKETTESKEPGKILAVAVDFGDNVSANRSSERCYSPQEIRQMLEYFRSVGIRRLYWFHDVHNRLYEGSFHGKKNLLAFACEAAHEKGMECFSVIKPFETGIQLYSIPPHLKPPAAATRSIQGWHIFVSSFTAKHPEFRLKYRQTPQSLGSGQVRKIKLVKRDAERTSLDPEAVKILWSDKNSQYRSYEGPRTFSQQIEQREDGAHRVFEWCDLKLPAKARYVLLRYIGDKAEGDFANTVKGLVELYDEKGRIPSVPDQGLVSGQPSGLLDWGIEYPEATRAILDDEKQRKEAFRNHYRFDVHAWLSGERVFNKVGGCICHCLDFNTYCTGAMHPCYPEVRQYWLDWVASSLEAGVDGVALRIANHSSYTSWPTELGYNEPVLQELAKRGISNPDIDEPTLAMVREVNGAFYTQFVRDCSQLVRGQGKKLYHFVQPCMDGLVYNGSNNVPETFRFDYRHWLREGLLDGLCLRPQSGQGRWSTCYFGDMVGAVARYFGVKMFYANENGALNGSYPENQVPLKFQSELEHVRRSDLYDGFILYEAASIMGIDEAGVMRTSGALQEVTVTWRSSQE